MTDKNPASGNDTSFDNRVQREQAAYDEGNVLENNAKLQQRFQHVFQCPNTLHAERYFDDSVKEAAKIPGSRALDYGCNSGWYSKKLKDWGFAEIQGIDISTKAIKEAQETHQGVGKFQVMDGHKTSFPDNHFNLVVGRAILHHLDFKTAVSEIHRILKPGGRAIFFEPLRDNPAAKIIRWMTPKSRTKDELPLSAEQIRWADGIFGKERHLFIGLWSVGLGIGSSLVSKNADNAALRLAHQVDIRIGKSPLKYWMRSVVLVWEKK